MKKNAKTSQKTDKKFHYKVFAFRVAEEIIDWLKWERRQYDSWNIFFREIKRRYDEFKEAKSDNL